MNFLCKEGIGMKETREAIDRITSRLDHLEQRTEELIRSQKRFDRLLITFISFFFRYYRHYCIVYLDWHP